MKKYCRKNMVWWMMILCMVWNRNISTRAEEKESCYHESLPEDYEGTLTMWGWDEKYFTTITQAFQEKYKNVTFEYTEVDGAKLLQKYEVALLTGKELPDIGWAMIDYRGEMFELDMWEHLEEAPYGMSLNQVYEYLHPRMVNSKGNICGIEQSLSPVALMYRKDLAKKYLGTDDPEELETMLSDWDSFIEKGKEVQQKSKGNVYIFFGSNDILKIVQSQQKEVWVDEKTINAEKTFGKTLDLMCRFRSAAEQKKTIEKLKKGEVDIIIGTHRILSKDVQFKDLGLLVIDEEQRFGVTHKEKIKQMKVNVDVLTLTATPIPRTLHMSLIGIRDMSVLEEPPMDRVPIQTYVMEYNDELVREAINRELARNGQVYYVYNKVRDIADITAKLQELVPDATVAFAHGQMKETELERIMYRFINGEIDVLVSTTIIETGLDISNVNTMIIHDADNMGLSQLYQLRGRVGRSNRTAYAFLMYRRNKMLKEVAEKRLAAIKEYSDLGSGFKIAMRDLEIRGAGNLLGAEQSGHMEAVGYDLYCKMLSEAVKEAKGIEDISDKFDTTVDIVTDAYIPAGYIANEFQKLDIYKRIAGIETEEEKDEMLEELIDRFGEPPKSVLSLLRVARLKALAHAVYITEIKQTGSLIKLTMFERARINPEKIPELIAQYKSSLKFNMAENPYFTFDLKNGSVAKKRDVLDVVEELISQMRKELITAE